MKLSLRSIFRCMMEDGYYPSFEKNCILFDLEDNTGVVEYQEGVLSIRIFFSIEPDTGELFKDVSNTAMTMTFAVKPVVIDEMKNLMFSCEFLCDTEREFRKFFPRGIGLLKEALEIHKHEMKKIIMAQRISATSIPATDDISSMAGISGSNKVLS